VRKPVTSEDHGAIEVFNRLEGRRELEKIRAMRVAGS